MKSFFVAVAIFAVLVASGIAFDLCLNDTTETLLEYCDKIADDIGDTKFKDAYRHTEALAEYIDRKKPLLSSILDHSNIDEIEKEISTLSGYTQKCDTVNSVVGVKNLKHMLKHLPENYSLKLQNIL